MTEPSSRDEDLTRDPDADVRLVRDLAAILNDARLAEIEYANGPLEVRLTKYAAAPPAEATPTEPRSEPAAAAVGATPGEPPPDSPGLLTSPMVGVAYTAPEPGAAPYFEVGDTVSPGDTVMLIEAMKVFNPIKVHRAGRITKIFVGNGTPVEYGEPLLVIE